MLQRLRMLSVEVNNNVHALFIYLQIFVFCFVFFVLLIALTERWDDLIIKLIFCGFLASRQIKTLVKLSNLNQEKQLEHEISKYLKSKKKKKTKRQTMLRFLSNIWDSVKYRKLKRTIQFAICKVVFVFSLPGHFTSKARWGNISL